ncbi:MAG TPA: LytR C-terminal domain-containing protein [Acidimicrobiales bacterium]|nr:LytR C-terminal domain-containing protein [Acidimicrobiales bacterium]
MSPAKALIVLVVFVVAVITLVAVGTRPRATGTAPPTTTSTTAATSTTSSTTTTTTVPHSSVSVVVANATETNGLAAHFTSVLQAQAWAMKTPTDASTTESKSVVYYASGQQASAAVIATELGLQANAVQPLTTAVPVPGVSGIDVVVVIGEDLASAG